MPKTEPSFRKIDTRVEKVNTRLVNVSQTLPRTEPPFGKIDTRFEKVDVRLMKVSRTLPKTEQTSRKIDTRSGKVDTRHRKIAPGKLRGAGRLERRYGAYDNILVLNTDALHPEEIAKVLLRDTNLLLRVLCGPGGRIPALQYRIKLSFLTTRSVKFFAITQENFNPSSHILFHRQVTAGVATMQEMKPEIKTLYRPLRLYT